MDKRKKYLLNDEIKKAKASCLTHAEFNDLLLTLNPSERCKNFCYIPSWINKTWYMDEIGKSNSKVSGGKKPTRMLLIIKSVDKNDEWKFTKYYTNIVDDSKNKITNKLQGQTPGNYAYNTVRKYFNEQYGVGFKKAFGITEAEFKYCVPKQFYWKDDRYQNVILNNISSVDFCSHYPTNLCGSLPDAHTAKKMPGRIAPTAEYPFAFYLRSGCVAEYNNFDTHDWVNSRFFSSLFFDYQISNMINFNDDTDEVTVLMKASKYELTEAMHYFYNKRHDNELFKLVMNAFIGTLHSVSYTNKKYAHIAAIAIARANEKMRKLAETIKHPIHICVDGLIYQGNQILGTNKKELGQCNQEFLSCEFKFTGMNVYVAKKDNKIIKFKHGAYDSRDDNKDIDYCEGFEYLNHLKRTTDVQKTIELLNKYNEVK